MKMKRNIAGYIILSLFQIGLFVHFYPGLSLSIYPDYQCVSSRRIKGSDFRISTLLDSGLSENKIEENIIGHLWQSWDEILPNLSYVAENFGDLYANYPAVVEAFFISLLTDMRASIVPSLAANIDAAYENLDKISSLWNIENKLTQVLLSLDQYSGGTVYSMRFLVNSLYRLMPGRINVNRFKQLYEESNARGRAEIIYTDGRDWTASRHGVAERSTIVMESEKDKVIAELEKDDCVISEVRILQPGDFTQMNPELKDLSSGKLNSELSGMVNNLQRPFRLDGYAIGFCYEWWKSNVGEEVQSAFEKGVEVHNPDWYSWGSPSERIENLTAIRKELAKIMYSENTPTAVKIATIIFDKAVGAVIKNQAMQLAGWYQSRFIKEPGSGIKPRENTASDYKEIVDSLNNLLVSLTYDRSFPHRLWLSNTLGQELFIQINPYDEKGNLDSHKLYNDILYLEAVLSEVVEAMHGEEFEPGAEIVPSYNELISSKFADFQDEYQKVVETHTTIFPTLDALKAHVVDTPIALSLLRQVELFKDALKSMLGKDYPALFYDSEGLISLLRKIEDKSYLYTDTPIERMFEKASSMTAQEANGLMVTNIVSYPEDASKVILVAVKNDGDSIKTYHVITSKDNLPLERIDTSIIKAQYSDGIGFPVGIYQTVRYFPHLKPEEVSNKIVIAQNPDPNIINLFDQNIVGIICDTGGVTTHLINIARGVYIPGLTATGIQLSQLLLRGMPISVVGDEIYLVQYVYREGDVAYKTR